MKGNSRKKEERTLCWVIEEPVEKNQVMIE